MGNYDYDQLTVFDLAFPQFRINKKIRLIELFAGVGSQAMALRDMGADFEYYRISEWEVNANRSYKAIHNPNDNMDYSKKFEKFKWLARALYEYGISVDGKTRLTLKEIRNRGEKWCKQIYNEFRANHNLGSIVNARSLDLSISNTDKFYYIITYSFPCQDLSAAGKRKGMAKGSGTRSGLLWEVERLLNECEELPQVLLMENVPQVHSRENIPDFQKWIDFLAGKGYSNYWQDLNAKDYGVAQNRERCFMVSLRGEWNYKFPQPLPLKRRIKDYLEDEVDEKYYINNEKAQKLIQTLIENGALDRFSDFEMERNFNQRGKVHGEESICRTIFGGGHTGNEPKVFVDLSLNNPNKKTLSNCITARDRGISNQQSVGNGVMEIKERRLGNIYDFDDGNYAGNVYDEEMLSPTIQAHQGGNQQSMIVAMRGRNPSNSSIRTAGGPTEQKLEPNSLGICNTLTSVQKDNMVLEIEDQTPLKNCQCRIRKLTPLECWRLMGFSDEDFRKAEGVNSNTQLYKQAGNSLVKIVMMAILSQLNIKGIKAWNSMNSKERSDIVEETS